MDSAYATSACWLWSAFLGPSIPQRGPADARQHVKWLLGGQLLIVAFTVLAYLVD